MKVTVTHELLAAWTPFPGKRAYQCSCGEIVVGQTETIDLMYEQHRN